MNKIPDVSSLVTETAITAVENEMPDISSFVKKQSMTQKSVNLKRNLLIIIMAYVLLLQSNTLAADVFNARLARANSIDKTDFDNKLSSLSWKIMSNKSKHLLVENEINKLKKLYLDNFLGRWYIKLFSISASTKIFENHERPKAQIKIRKTMR